MPSNEIMPSPDRGQAGDFPNLPKKTRIAQEKYDLAPVKEGLRLRCGSVTKAAGRLGMSRQGLRLYVERHAAELKAFMTELRERELDFSEDVLAAARRSGDVRADLQYLERFGRQHGLASASICGGQVAPDHAHVVTLADVDKSSTEQLGLLLAATNSKTLPRSRPTWARSTGSRCRW